MNAKPPTTSDILGNDGVIARLLPGFEARPQQMEMARQVDAALEGRGLLVAEAATGTGKSLAYLVPIALHAIKTDRPVVVSSSTHVLQDQLISKDVPLVRHALAEFGIEVTAAEAKGMGNYACQRDIESAAVGRLALNLEASAMIQRLHEWMRASDGKQRGWLAQQLATRRRRGVERSARGSRHLYTRGVQPLRDVLLLRGATQDAGAPRIIVANHSLVFADLAVCKEEGGRVLPNYSVLVIDEAHKMEDAATSFLGGDISAGSLRYAMKQLSSGKSGGALERISQQIPTLKLGAKEKRALPEFIDRQVVPEVVNLDVHY